MRRIAVARDLERLGEPLGLPSAGLGDVVAASPASADLRGGLADHRRRGEPALDRATAEVGDQRDLAVADAAEHHRGVAVALLDPVGELEQRALIGALALRRRRR